MILAIEMKGMLIGESARPETLRSLRAAIDASSHVERTIDIRTQFLGPDDLLVACKVEFHDTLSADQVAVAIREVEVAIRTAVPFARPIYIEPDFLEVDEESLAVEGADERPAGH